MLTYSLNTSSNKSLYQQIYENIKLDICSGVLPRDSKLPSKRAFAKNLGVSVITVEGAYEQLLAEGYIYSRPRSGFFVSGIFDGYGQKTTGQDKSDLIADHKSDSVNVLYDLVSTRTLTDNFPFTTWTRLMRRLITENAPLLMQTPPPGGVMELREAIAKHLKDFSQINVSPEQIIIGAGTEYLYGLLVQLLGRDKLYALETPGYTKARLVYSSQDVEVVSIPMDENGLRPDLLKDSHADILQISPSHHFPTGMVTPVSRRYDFLSWASEGSGRFILEDDFDSELRLSGSPIPPLYSIDVSGKVIYLNTFTKTLSPTIRISYMVLPPSLVDSFYDKLSFYSCTVSNFEQYTLAAFINEGFFEKHIGRLRKHYRAVRDNLLEAIEGSFPKEKIEIKEEDAGLHFLLKIKSNLSDERLKELAKANGIGISFLSDYSEDNTLSSGTAVLSYSGIHLADIDDIVLRLSRAWQSA